MFFYLFSFCFLALLVDTIRDTDPISSSDALVYSVGAVKLLCSNSSFHKMFVRNNCIEATGKLLHSINTQVSVFINTQVSVFINTQVSVFINTQVSVFNTQVSVLSTHKLVFLSTHKLVFYQHTS